MFRDWHGEDTKSGLVAEEHGIVIDDLHALCLLDCLEQWVGLRIVEVDIAGYHFF